MEREGGLAFIESLAELLRRLLDYRTVHQGDEFRDLHMHVMFNLLVRGGEREGERGERGREGGRNEE